VKKRKKLIQTKSEQGHRENRYRSLVDIGIALSSEKELEKILDLILSKALENTHADGASIYLTESIRIDSIGNSQRKFYPVLRFHRTANRSQGVKIQNQVLDMTSSIAGHVASTAESVRIDDCYELSHDSTFQFNVDFDIETGYRTKSMLAVPMQSSGGKVRGVLQMINKLQPDAINQSGQIPKEEDILSFTDEDAELMKAFASQACVAIENAKLQEDIENLFESFIRASVTAIEARDPSTSGHSDRVAVLTVEFARAVHQAPVGIYKSVNFSEQQIREIRYAALLHDFGKIGVREEVLSKEKKLYPHELDVITSRLEAAKWKQEMLIWRDMSQELAELLQNGMKTGAIHDPSFQMAKAKQKVEQFQTQMQKMRLNILKANQPQIVSDDFDIADLMLWIQKTTEEIGDSLLTPSEVVKLSLSRGTLDAKERLEIESHVSHTYSFLRQIAWTEDLSSVADIAHAHHEKCDGTGYPRGLTAEHIPLQSKIMAISDIYDALTSMDRPYKKAVSAERALDILHHEGKHGKIDLELLKIFIESGTFRSVEGMSRHKKAA
jgi:HD-GYP domain-containing protein (c-di-GMP phosphodiesterase class II)